MSPYQVPLTDQDKCPKWGDKINLEDLIRGDYPISRRLFVVVKKDDSIDEKAGLAYTRLLLTNEGQELIEKAGFVRMLK